MSNHGKTKGALFVAIAACTTSITAWAAQPYLDDSNKTTPSLDAGAVEALTHPYPRVYQHEFITNASNSAVSKFDFVDAHGESYDHAEAVQQLSPSTMVLRHISGREYQGYNQNDACYVSSGVAFGGTGPISQGGPRSVGCNIYAGHWLYKAGSPLTQPTTNSATTLRVQDASKFTVGQYVVIYDAPAGSFKNPEHALVSGRDTNSDTLTLRSRGFKSSTYAHPAGAIVAQHVQGQGSDPELWAFNFSNKCPKDGAGKTYGDFYSGWLAKNYLKWKDGKTTTANVAGVMLDTDFYFELLKKDTDANNDLKTDNGMSGTGDNWNGDGYDDFYAWFEQRAPNLYLLSGVQDGRGYQWAQGNQMENWLDYGNGDFTPNPKYLNLNGLWATYLYNTGARTRGAPLVHNLTKTPTRLYPGNAKPTPPDNRPFRLGFGLTLMESGYYGTHSRYTADAWWDEFAVDVTPKSPTYGVAVAKTDVNNIYRHRGWLGKPKGRFTRVYSDTDFVASKSLLANGTFESNLTGWSSDSVSLTRTTATKMDGTAALQVSDHNQYQQTTYGARVMSSSFHLDGNKGYTLAFSARAAVHREIQISIGSENFVRIPVGPAWRRYVIGFQQKSAASTRVIFQVGREDSQVWLDSVYVFPGNTDVFRRDFDTGIVVANATPETRTIALGGLFRRIKGSQDPSVNNGQSVTAVTLPPYDGLVLVRAP